MDKHEGGSLKEGGGMKGKRKTLCADPRALGFLPLFSFLRLLRGASLRLLHFQDGQNLKKGGWKERKGEKGKEKKVTILIFVGVRKICRARTVHILRCVPCVARCIVLHSVASVRGKITKQIARTTQSRFRPLHCFPLIFKVLGAVVLKAGKE